MSGKSKIVAAKVATALFAIPVLILAFKDGPDPRHTGAPGDLTCAKAGCHAGTPRDGGIEINFGGSNTYVPGVKQRWTVRITGAQTPVYGFQATARLASNLSNGQAGSFNSVDATTQVICEDGRPVPCRAEAPVQFIEHTRPKNSNTFEFEWTPPATDVGNVRVYIAANAANGNDQNTGDQILLANFTLTPGAAAPKPEIRREQPVLQAFSGRPGLSAGTWVEIYGANLSSVTREWAGSDFEGNRAPTVLNGVKVFINNKPAFVRYISPTQVNVQAPDDDAVGPVNVEAETAAGRSAPVSLQKTKVSPALLTTPAFNVGGKQYMAALHTDFRTFVGRENLIAGVPFRPAKPGDAIILFAVGCGTTNPATPAGQFFNEARPLALPYQVRFGERVAEAQGFLAAGAVGLCQFNATVPDLPDGDTPIDVTVDTVPTGQTLFTTIQR